MPETSSHQLQKQSAFGIGPIEIRVRYSETDRMGIVYHVNYIEYFELARSEWIRRFWKPYREIEDEGYFLLVIEVGIQYLHPARYDDLLEVRAFPSDWGNSRVEFEYQIDGKSDGKTICTGFSRHCFADRSGKPVKMPPELKQLLQSNVESS